MIKVAMVSSTALAGAPLETMKCLNKYASGDLSVRWIAGRTSYGDGRVFPKDLLWHEDRGAALSVLRDADVIHIQNGYQIGMEPYFSDKRILCQWHSVPQQAAFYQFKDVCRHQYTIMQPMQMGVYHELKPLPNMMDPEEYRPIERHNPMPMVVFAPTNDWPVKMPGSKGKAEVEHILRVQTGFDKTVFNRDHYEYNLVRKSQGDILIDDVVAPSFHKTTIEGCCFGLAVITGAPNQKWVQADLSTLPESLFKLVHEPEYLAMVKESCRNFVETDYHPKNLVGMYLEAYKRCLE